MPMLRGSPKSAKSCGVNAQPLPFSATRRRISRGCDRGGEDLAMLKILSYFFIKASSVGCAPQAHPLQAGRTCAGRVGYVGRFPLPKANEKTGECIAGNARSGSGIREGVEAVDVRQSSRETTRAYPMLGCPPPKRLSKISPGATSSGAARVIASCSWVPIRIGGESCKSSNR